ncbi:hypothetical protein Tco_1359834 [Tanacetum coccineum]
MVASFATQQLRQWHQPFMASLRALASSAMHQQRAKGSPWHGMTRDDLRKAYEKCNDMSQESRALICTLLKESFEKDRKLHLSMYGKAALLEKQMGANLAWFQEKYSCHTWGGIDCLSSQANCPLTEKELHQLRMDEEALRETLEEEAMNKKAK